MMKLGQVTANAKLAVDRSRVSCEKLVPSLDATRAPGEAGTAWWSHSAALMPRVRIRAGLRCVATATNSTAVSETSGGC